MNRTSTHAGQIPAIDGTELAGILDDLAGIHYGVDLIRDGIHAIASARLTTDDTQLLMVTLAGSPDGTDLLTAIGHLVARITDADTNPALRTLTPDVQKTTRHHGELLVHDLTDPDLHQHASNASGAIHTD